MSVSGAKWWTKASRRASCSGCCIRSCFSSAFLWRARLSARRCTALARPHPLAARIQTRGGRTRKLHICNALWEARWRRATEVAAARVEAARKTHHFSGTVAHTHKLKSVAFALAAGSNSRSCEPPSSASSQSPSASSEPALSDAASQPQPLALLKQHCYTL